MYLYAKQKTNQKEQPLKQNQKSEQNDDEEQPLKSNQLSCSVKIYDSSSNNNTSIKQYISMINDEMNSLLKQTKLNVDVMNFQKLYKLNKNMNTS